MLKCRITQNIHKSCDTHNSGIFDKIYLYDFDYIKSLTFSNDTRLDGGKGVSVINSTKDYFVWDVSDGEYTEELDGDTYTHEVTFNIHKTQAIEDILSDAKNSYFLVCFRLKSENVYRMVGWELGAKLTYSLTVGEDGNYYTVTFSDEGTYPAFEVSSSNFDYKHKTYTPLYVPNFDFSYCETDSSHNMTGYRIAQYVTKQNTAGEALDENNRLCEYSGKKQCAYRLSSVSDSDFQIVGTYETNATFNGQNVRVYDLDGCNGSSSGSIVVSPTELTLSVHSNPTGTVTISTSDRWFITNNVVFATASPMSGKGDATVAISWNGVKNKEWQNIIIHDTDTNVQKLVNIYMYGINIEGDDTISYQKPTAIYDVPCFGSSYGWDYSVTSSSSTMDYTVEENDSASLKVTINDTTTIPPSGAKLTITVWCTNYPSEKVSKTITITSDETNPNWVLVSSYCETDSDGNRTGYKIAKYRDMNSQSATYMETKTTKELSDDCSMSGETWVVISQYCETDDEGYNTGNLIQTLKQTNPEYETYGNTKTKTVVDTTTCPITDRNPKWEDITTVCLTDEYGQTGQIQRTQKDTNEASPTYNTERTITETDETACVPNKDPYWVTESSECETEEE